MAINIDPFFKELFTKFLEIDDDLQAVIVSDHEGFIIAGEKKLSVDVELVSVLTALINPILERMRSEFAFKKFGTATFDTELYRLLFISIDEITTLSVVLSTVGSIDKISPYAFFLAEKTAQILNANEGDSIQLSIPHFEIETRLSEDSGRIKEQIYQMRLDSGGKYKFKCILIGDHEVGKTSIVRQFVEKKFSHDYRSTIGIDIMSYSIEFYGNEIIFNLWDLGAQEFFKRFRKTYYSGAQAGFIVFDVTNNDSFLHVKEWYQELKESSRNREIPIVIIGNKIDLDEQRIISYEKGDRLSSELASLHYLGGISYIETSAKTGENIEDAFNLIAYHYIMKNKEMEEEKLRLNLVDIINSILEKKRILTISFVTENPYFSPGLQILTEINKICKCEKVQDDKELRYFAYSNGLTIRNYLYDNIEISGSDGVFVIFDARNKEDIDSRWKKIIIKILEKIDENKVVLIGIRISDNSDWSQVMKKLNINKYLEKKMVSLLFFKIGSEYRLEIYDQLEVMLSSIKDLS